MKKVRAALRLLVIVILLILAFSGIGITGNFLNANRERYMDRQIKTEQVEKREDEEDDDKEKK